jgi:ABC-type transport system substrate-binding protein
VALAALAALPAGSARRPRYGGTLRVEVGETIRASDLAAPAAGPWGAAAQSAISALIYDRDNADSFPGPAGAGPFRVAMLEPGKRLTLAANEDYPGGRPFVDTLEIQMGRAAKDRLLDLELNKTDLAEIPAEEARHAAERGIRVSASKPDQLLAVIFIGGRPAAENARLREVFSGCIDRVSIVDFILQREGEPAGGLLPQWSSGTAFLFPAAVSSTAVAGATANAGAKEQPPAIGDATKIVLGYDAADGLQQRVAERIAVNAHEAGLVLALTAISNSAAGKEGADKTGTAQIDARLVRIAMRSPRPREALAGLIEEVAPIAGPTAGIHAAPPLPDPASPEQVYERERAIVEDHRIVPLAWVPQVYGLSARVRDWQPPAAGEAWMLADVWLDGAREPGAAR